MSKNNKHRLVSGLVIVGILVVAMIFAGGLIRNKPTTDRNALKETVISVKTTEVFYQNLEKSVIYSGRVNSQETVNLGAEVTGRIMAGDIPFKKGQSFKRNDLLVHINDVDARAGLRAQKSSFLSSLSTILPDIRVDYPDEYKKWRSFFDAVNMDKPLPELPETHSDQEKVFLASRGILASYYTIEQQEITLTRYKIYAPFDGAFVQVTNEVGAIASKGQTLAQIIRTDKLELEVPVLPEDARWFNSGDRVKISESNASRTLTGKVSRVSDFVDPATQSISIYVSLNPSVDFRIYEGQYLQAEFSGAVLNQVMELPREAVFDGTKVFSVVDNKLKTVNANVVRKFDDTILLNGLEAGTVIVAESLVNAADGMAVQALKDVIALNR